MSSRSLNSPFISDKSKTKNEEKNSSDNSIKDLKNKKKSPTLIEQLFNFILSAIKIIIGICLTGFLINWLILQYENQTFMQQPLGSFLQVKNDRKINYICLGNENAERTVWVIPGMVVDYIVYLDLIMEAAVRENSDLRICSYARSGRLWSDQSPNATKIDNELNDLIALIGRVSKTRKVTLIGHSMGGIFAARYALEKPTLVEKLILVDPMPANITNQTLIVKKLEKISIISEILSIIGVMRILTVFKPPEGLYDIVRPEHHKYLNHEMCSSNVQSLLYKEIDLGLTLALQVKERLEDKNFEPFKDIPTYIFLSEISNPSDLEVTEEWHAIWKEEKILPSISTRSTLEIVKESDHFRGLFPKVLPLLKAEKGKLI